MTRPVLVFVVVVAVGDHLGADMNGMIVRGILLRVPQPRGCALLHFMWDVVAVFFRLTVKSNATILLEGLVFMKYPVAAEQQQQQEPKANEHIKNPKNL